MTAHLLAVTISKRSGLAVVDTGDGPQPIPIDRETALALVPHVGEQVEIVVRVVSDAPRVEPA